jgi:hypothetical protein
MKTKQPDLRVDPEALATIASFLDESGYVSAVSRTVGREPFPEFRALQARVGNASPFHQLALSLFLQGHSVGERYLRGALPERVIDACLATGILSVNHLYEYSTGGRGISTIAGAVVFADLPRSYPTSLTDGAESDEALASMHPAPAAPVRVLRERRCLIAESEPAWRSAALHAAAAGAKQVRAIIADAKLHSCVAVSAHLSHLGHILEVADSLPAAIGERDFEYVADLCERDAGIDSALTLGQRVKRICEHAAPEFEGRIDCYAEGTARAIAANEAIYDFARKQSISVQSVVFDKFMHASAEGERESTAREERMTHFFRQTLLLKRSPNSVGELVTIPLYDSKRSDPLISLVSRYRAAC